MILSATLATPAGQNCVTTSRNSIKTPLQTTANVYWSFNQFNAFNSDCLYNMCYFILKNSLSTKKQKKSFLADNFRQPKFRCISNLGHMWRALSLTHGVKVSLTFTIIFSSDISLWKWNISVNLWWTAHMNISKPSLSVLIQTHTLLMLWLCEAAYITTDFTTHYIFHVLLLLTYSITYSLISGSWIRGSMCSVVTAAAHFTHTRDQTSHHVSEPEGSVSDRSLICSN